MKPLVLVNFKTYVESSGKNALKLVQKLSKIKSNSCQIAVAPSLLTAAEVVKIKLPVFAQHADALSWGAHTGSILPAELKELGVQGVVLNHSEKKLSLKVIKETIQLCQKEKLQTVICCSNLNELKQIVKLHPDYLAYEPQELIGKETSVVAVHPKIITQAVELTRKISSKTKLLCGAGIHSQADFQTALKLGARGILISHAVVKAKNPEKFLQQLISQSR